MILFGKKIIGKAIFGLLVIGIMIALAAFFHHGVYLTDALTDQRIDDINVIISPWRVIFEPVMGPLMFCLRGHDTLVEFMVLMVWVLGILLLIGLIRNMRIIPGSIFRRLGLALVRWLAIVPVVLILWIGLTLLMIFAPLPTNIIRCNRDNTALVNFHSHTYYSHDGLISPENLVKWHQRNGFDAFFITEHNHHNKTLKFIAARDAILTGDEKICVLPGQEYSGSNHLLLLGLTHDFITKDMADSVAVDTVHAQNGVVVVAHWFADEHRSIQYYIDCGVDGFEIANQGEGIDYDRRIFQNIVSACQKNGLLMMGNVDYHGYGNACYVWNALNIPLWDDLSYFEKKDSIMSILRGKQTDKIQVVTYCDRRFLNRSLLWLSPVLNAIDYFRSFNVWQMLSWLVWISGFGLVVKLHAVRCVNSWLNVRHYRKAALVGFASAAFALVNGIRLLLMAPPLTDYNEILIEYGAYFVIGGFLFIAYSVILFKRNIK